MARRGRSAGVKSGAAVTTVAARYVGIPMQETKSAAAVRTDASRPEIKASGSNPPIGRQ